MPTLTLTRPDDWHLHVRDGAALAAVVPDTARRFGRAIIMPNLRPPVTTVEQAAAYRQRILAAVPAGLKFDPLMTLYLTDTLKPEEIDKAADSGFVVAAKLYPAGATTNSDAGVTDIARIDAVLERMAERGVVLCVHGEVTHGDVDIFDRERVFIDRVLAPLAARHPALRIVFEHITTPGGAVRERSRAQRGRHHHRPPPALQPQRDLHRRHPPALLLPAGAEARNPPGGAGQGGHLGQQQVLPRHRLGAPRQEHQGSRLRLRRLLHRPRRHRALRRGLRAGRRPRQARSLRQLQRARLLPPAAQPDTITLVKEDWRCRRPSITCRTIRWCRCAPARPSAGNWPELQIRHARSNRS
jgi:hypothetical protein